MQRIRFTWGIVFLQFCYSTKSSNRFVCKRCLDAGRLQLIAIAIKNNEKL